MITDLEQYQNQIKGLPSLEDVRYENIFKVAKTDKFFFYNIIKKISLGEVYKIIKPDYVSPILVEIKKLTRNG